MVTPKSSGELRRAGRITGQSRGGRRGRSGQGGQGSRLGRATSRHSGAFGAPLPGPPPSFGRSAAYCP
eukprot:7185063-Alexandrium_andersonii.AAC.1